MKAAFSCLDASPHPCFLAAFLRDLAGFLMCSWGRHWACLTRGHTQLAGSVLRRRREVCRHIGRWSTVGYGQQVVSEAQIPHVVAQSSRLVLEVWAWAREHPTIGASRADRLHLRRLQAGSVFWEVETAVQATHCRAAATRGSNSCVLLRPASLSTRIGSLLWEEHWYSRGRGAAFCLGAYPGVPWAPLDQPGAGIAPLLVL